MLGAASLPLGALVIVVFVAWLVGRLRGGRSVDEQESLERHRDAQNRDPPVEIGESYEAGVVDFSEHHTGARHAICKVEGFVVFVEDIPTTIEVGDVLRFKILSFNRGHTSATGTFLESP